jgi:hypothetical protein
MAVGCPLVFVGATGRVSVCETRDDAMGCAHHHHHDLATTILWHGPLASGTVLWHRGVG